MVQGSGCDTCGCHKCLSCESTLDIFFYYPDKSCLWTYDTLTHGCSTNIFIFASIFLKMAISTQNAFLHVFWPFILKSFTKLGRQQMVKDGLCCYREFSIKTAVLLRLFSGQGITRSSLGVRTVCRMLHNFHVEFFQESCNTTWIMGRCNILMKDLRRSSPQIAPINNNS